MFGTRLKILREGDDLSQAKFAQEIGFSQSSIASWENGTREPGMTPKRSALNNRQTTTVWLEP